jgi:hypothetical protein
MSFLPDVTFSSGLPRPPDPPPTVPPPPPKRPRPRHRRRTLRPSTLTVLIDRIEAALEGDQIDLLSDDAEADQIAITTGELALLLTILFPEEFPPGERRKPRKGTATAPGSEARIAEYAARRAAGLYLYAQGDARADGPGRGVVIVQRANGSGVKVVGWEDETDEEE